MKEILLFNLWGDKLEELQTQARSKTSLTLDERAYLYDDDNFRKVKEEFGIRVQEVLNLAQLHMDYNILLQNFTERCIWLFNDYINRVGTEKLKIEEVEEYIDVWLTSCFDCISDVSVNIPIKKDRYGVANDPTSAFRSATGEFICSRIIEDVGRYAEGYTEQLKKRRPATKKEKSTPRKPFEDCILVKDKSEDVVAILGKLIKGKKGKSVAMIIRAAMKAGYILKPSYAMVVNKFGEIGTKSNFDKYMGYQYESAELSPIIYQLRDNIK